MTDSRAEPDRPGSGAAAEGHPGSDGERTAERSADPDAELLAPLLELERAHGTEATLALSVRPVPTMVKPDAPTLALPGSDSGSGASPSNPDSETVDLAAGSALTPDSAITVDADSATIAVAPPSRSAGDSGRAASGAATVLTDGAGDTVGVSSPEATSIERFRLGETIGEGGMGRIVRARQLSLERDVAIKLIHRPDDRTRDLFLSEVQVTGRLEHANIVPVHTLGLDRSGDPQLAMTLVQGTEWADLIHDAARERPLRDHIEILIQVCHGLEYAHEERILHRDLKPANVMVGRFGQVYVMDWGLAVTLDPELAARTSIRLGREVREIAGTPGYMSPELASGEGDQQDERTDVYLAGACLHEVLTGSMRHRGSSVLQVVRQAMASEPYDYDPDVPAELAGICRRAMAPRREDRFPSMAALREALEAYLEHEQAHHLTRRGMARADELEAAIADGRTAADVYELFTEARFSLRNALELWSGDDSARAGLRRIHRLFVRDALEREDLESARRALPTCEDAGLEAEVTALEETLRARARELEGLREHSRALDWQSLARPMSNLFLLAGLLIGGGAGLVYAIKRSVEPGLAFVLINSYWSLCLLTLGGVAWSVLHSHRDAGRLASSRFVQLWAFVAGLCLLNGALAGAGFTDPFGTATSASLLAAGLAATALQTDRRLLLPAALMAAIVVPLRLLGDLGIVVLGAAWIVTFLAIAYGLRAAGRDSDPEPDPGAPPA